MGAGAQETRHHHARDLAVIAKNRDAVLDALS